MDYTRNMLSTIRSQVNEHKNVALPREETINENDNLLTRFNLLMEEAELTFKSKNDNQGFVVRKKDVQFGSVRASQEDAIRKTVGDVKLKDDALKYYANIQDIVLNGQINGLGITFQFRYKDPSGDGLYIWADGLQLTDSNLRTVEKIRDAFLNWKQSLVEDGDLLDKLHKAAIKD